MLISDFYTNQVIFLTGATGFIGKALIEKLLRSCPGISKIYVLVRVKKGKTARERLNVTLQDPAFRPLLESQPEVLDKIQIIEGDCSKLKLGISPDDLERINDVTIIIHSAATVRFDDPLRESIKLNTRGTHELIKIALNLPKLIAFEHISTTYTNPSETVVEEKVYDPTYAWREALQISENIDDTIIEILTKKILSVHPNTYTFTKNLGEQVVNEFRDKLPIAIFRPSIIVASMSEPLPGWIDNVNGPTGMIVACGTGLKRCDQCKGDTLLAIVPIDIVIRGIIILGYKIAMENSKEMMRPPTTEGKELEVVNCALVDTAPMTINKMIRTGERMLKKKPFEKTIWVPGGQMYETLICYQIHFLFQQFPIAIIFDCLLLLTGRKTIAIKLQRIFVNMTQIMRRFMNNSWIFKNEKFFALENWVTQEEKEVFGFRSLCFIDYEKYLDGMIYGIREYILKEPRYPSTAAFIRMKTMIGVHFILKVILAYFSLSFLYRKLMLFIDI